MRKEKFNHLTITITLTWTKKPVDAVKSHNN